MTTSGIFHRLCLKNSPRNRRGQTVRHIHTDIATLTPSKPSKNPLYKKQLNLSNYADSSTDTKNPAYGRI